MMSGALTLALCIGAVAVVVIPCLTYKWWSTRRYGLTDRGRAHRLTPHHVNCRGVLVDLNEIRGGRVEYMSPPSPALHGLMEMGKQLDTIYPAPGTTAHAVEAMRKFAAAYQKGNR